MEDALIILAKTSSDLRTSHEQHVLSQWASNSTQNNQFLEDLKLIQENRLLLRDMSDFPIPIEVRTDASSAKRNSLIVSLILIALVGVLTYNIFFKATPNVAFEFLPDQTEIHLLSANASIKLMSEFNTFERKLEMDGDIFFDVQKSDKPFIITLNQGEIKVVGTSFRILELSEHSIVEVISGVVQVSNVKDKVFLTKGQGAKLYDENIELIEPQMITPLFSYKFENASLVEIFKILEQKEGVKILFDKEKAKSCYITSTFQNASIKDVFEELSVLIGFQVSFKNDHIMIDNIGC